MVNLHRRGPGRDRKILSDHRQDGKIVVGIIGNLGTLRPIGRDIMGGNPLLKP